MRIVVNTPTGNVGREVVRRLLSSNRDLDVMLLARHPEKVADFASRGAEVRQGSLEDAAFVREATRGAEQLFWVTPSPPGSPDLNAFQRRLGRIAASAVERNRIPRVVDVSSVGAHDGRRMGPVTGLRDVERMLNEVCASVLHLRPAFYFENLLAQVESIRAAGSIFLPLPPDLAFPMVATRDVAEVAARWLLDDAWTGVWVVGVHGPSDLTPDEAALAVGRGLDRPVSYVRIPERQAREALVAAGVGASAADGLMEMYRAMAEGRMAPAEPRTTETTTPTDLESFAREVMAPLVGDPPAA